MARNSRLSVWVLIDTANSSRIIAAIMVAVAIDEARRQHEPASVNHLVALLWLSIAYRNDARAVDTYC